MTSIFLACTEMSTIFIVYNQQRNKVGKERIFIEKEIWKLKNIAYNLMA